MVFGKLLKREYIEFDIKIDKSKYDGGQKVKGSLTIQSKRETKVRGLRLIAEGIESARISVSERSSLSSSSYYSHTNNSSTTKSESNAFFSFDLSGLLHELCKKDFMDNDSVVVKSGTKEIPFEFTIPADAYPSYSGRHAAISCNVKATADRDNWFDKNKTISFTVINSRHTPNQTIINESKGYENFNNTQTESATVTDNGKNNNYESRRKLNALSHVSMTGEGK